ncbi:LamG domain-containing protein [Orenia marismortui]|uniref:Concanavalin A-like lectin/glucanase superfamily protein n=1 Tax=Orenia marismortui TaxID=46469 RepID=A0A4R8GPG0_9FIRM|nr:LamG domain-containing protein [Orenia marismortui]TDX45194.1 concanavalin A-like lectin/glucanase superfamily protein [Orenia marismortui]
MGLQNFKEEEGSVLILILILMSVGIILITTMNNIIYNTSNRVVEENKRDQAILLAESALEVGIREVQNKTIKLGKGSWLSLNYGEGEYKIDTKLAEGDYLIIRGSGKINDRVKTLMIKRKLKKKEIEYEDFSFIEYFDGVDDVEVVDANQINLSNAATIEAFVKPDSNLKLPAIILSKDGAYNLGVNSNGEIFVEVYTTQNARNAKTITFDTDINQYDDWIHIAFTYDDNRNKEQAQLYINGEEIASAGNSIKGNLVSNNKDLIIGASEANEYSNYNQWQGEIKNIRVWDIAQSNSDLAENSNKNITEENTVGVIYTYPKNQWFIVNDYSSSAEINLVNNSTAAGGTVLEIKNQGLYFKDINLAYDADKIYRVEVRIRQAEDANNDKQKFSIGMEGLDDSNNLVNIKGFDSHEGQYYMVLDSSELTESDGWQRFVGYFSGRSLDEDYINSTVENNPRSASLLRPMPLYSEVDYIRPVFIVNQDNGNGTAQIDYIKIEELLVN